MDEDIHLPLHCPQVTPVLLLIVPISFQLSTKENFWDIGKKNQTNKNNLWCKPVSQHSFCDTAGVSSGLGLWQAGVIIHRA